MLPATFLLLSIGLFCAPTQTTSGMPTLLEASTGHGFFVQTSCHLLSAKPAITTAADTLIPPNIPYEGYRIHVRQVKLVKQKQNRFLLRVALVNTGKRAIGFGPGFPGRLLQTDFDVAMAQGGLLSLAEPLRAAIMATSIKLEPGQEIIDQEYWLVPGEARKGPEARMDTFSRQASTISRAKSAKPIDAQVVPVAPVSCADLVIETIKIAQRGKSKVTVQISVRNQGKARLDAKAAGEGGLLDVYVGGSERISNSSRRLARVELSTRIAGLAGGKGLAPNESLTLIETLDLSGVTKYNGVLVVQIDPGQVIAECDETNNTGSLLLFE